jgi:DNA-binding beta-propeller fold protein YncE
MTTVRSSALLIVVAALSAQAAEKPPLELVRTISMPGVEGRIDHMAADIQGHKLFVAALGNNTLEVLDVEQGKRLHTITGLHEPQGVAYLPGIKRIVVANGEDGSCGFFDGQTYQPMAQIDCKEDADNVRYDDRAGRIFVGYGKGALTEIDLTKLARVADIQLPGHPESFQLEHQGSRIFVNVPSARKVVVVDRKTAAISARWPMEEFQANFPMALDETSHRLLIGCRKPARLAVLDTETGKTVASFPCAGDTDDVFYDVRLRRVYVSGGEGSVSVFQQADADHYSLLATIPTASGARTSLFVSAAHRLYVAVPHRGTQQAEVWEYRTPETEGR